MSVNGTLEPVQTLTGSASASPYIPERMAHKLTFTGAVEAEYDGSGAVEVKIPNGGGAVTPEEVAAAVEAYMEEHPVEVTESDPTVPAWAKAESKPTYTAAEVGALPDTYTAPVSSVNGQTGTVVLNAEDVGALPDTTQIPAVPAALPNPHKLTFTGAVSAEYDGSEAVSVEIPEGGGGGESEWKLINTITLTEAVREVTISEDSDGKPLSLKEVIVRQNVSCAESSIQNEHVLVNGQAVIGKMPIIKNTGYYGWADIVLKIEAGKVMAQCAYSDLTSPTPGAYNQSGFGYQHVTPFVNISYLSAEAINTLKFMCESGTVTFAENSSFTVWGR